MGSASFEKVVKDKPTKTNRALSRLLSKRGEAEEGLCGSPRNGGKPGRRKATLKWGKEKKSVGEETRSQNGKGGKKRGCGSDEKNLGKVWGGELSLKGSLTLESQRKLGSFPGSRRGKTETSNGGWVREKSGNWTRTVPQRLAGRK